MKRVLLLVSICGCADKVDDPPTYNCLDYATALLGMCFDAVGTEDVESQLQCDSGLLEVGYNACNMALETGVSVCIPYRDQFRSETMHGCTGYVRPPAPANWRDPAAREVDAPEREP